jgi:hypothetical protein
VKLARCRNPKAACLFSYVEIDLTQIQQYKEKQATLKGGHICRVKIKKEIKKMSVVNVFSMQE